MGSVWLIEKPNGLYLTLWDFQIGWTGDPYKAFRFARYEDAAAFNMTFFGQPPILHEVEHTFG